MVAVTVVSQFAAGVAPGEPVATFLRNGIPAAWANAKVRIAGGVQPDAQPSVKITTNDTVAEDDPIFAATDRVE